ncbi:MAG: hypothetical protein V4611_03495 [Patescibacteria group bacterium]
MTRLFDINAGQLHALLMALQNGGFTLENALDVIDDEERSQFVASSLRLKADLDAKKGHFTPYLRTLKQQQKLLLDLYDRFPQYERPQRYVIQELDTDSDHVQSIDDLEFYFVVCKTVEDTWRFNKRLIELTQPGVSGDFYTDMSLKVHQSAAMYNRGIHRIRINLRGDWQGNKKQLRSIEGIRAHALIDNEKLAGLEALAAYGLQDPLLLQMQCDNTLPGFSFLAGLTSGKDSSGILMFGKDPFGPTIRFTSWEAAFKVNNPVVPTLISTN